MGDGTPINLGTPGHSIQIEAKTVSTPSEIVQERRGEEED